MESKSSGRIRSELFESMNSKSQHTPRKSERVLTAQSKSRGFPAVRSRAANLWTFHNLIEYQYLGSQLLNINRFFSGRLMQTRSKMQSLQAIGFAWWLGFFFLPLLVSKNNNTTKKLLIAQSYGSPEDTYTISGEKQLLKNENQYWIEYCENCDESTKKGSHIYM